MLAEIAYYRAHHDEAKDEAGLRRPAAALRGDPAAAPWPLTLDPDGRRPRCSARCASAPIRRCRACCARCATAARGSSSSATGTCRCTACSRGPVSRARRRGRHLGRVRRRQARPADLRARTRARRRRGGRRAARRRRRRGGRRGRAGRRDRAGARARDGEAPPPERPRHRLPRGAAARTLRGRCPRRPTPSSTRPELPAGVEPRRPPPWKPWMSVSGAGDRASRARCSARSSSGRSRHRGRGDLEDPPRS